MKGLFITATNTDVGKTVITGAIAAAIKARGIDSGVMKPLASGGVVSSDGKLQSEDANFLIQAAGITKDKQHLVNSICLKPALTPAVAALQNGVAIDMNQVIAQCHLASRHYELILVEGVGGIAAPLWKDYLVADMIKELALPALIVTKPTMGTINSTILTAAYAKQCGINVVGVIINGWNEERVGVLERSNLSYIERLTNLPILGKFPFVPSISVVDRKTEGLAFLAEQHLDINHLLKVMEGCEATNEHK
jgi:dethiobiotin synthetase